MSELPEGWEIATLPEVARINPTIDKSAYADDLEVSFVPMPAVEAETGKIDVSQTKKFGEVKKGYTPFLQHDVLFAKITPCMENGKMAVVPTLHNDIGFGSTEFHVLRACEGVAPRYLYYYVSSKAYRYDAEHNMTGAVGQKRVPTPYIEKSKIPVPPTNEQNRIVAKIEELFSELDSGVESLKTAREQLKVYRQAMLKHAFEGKLTATWREKNKAKLESADKLLIQIKRERDEYYQQKLKEYAENIKAWEKKGAQGKKPSTPFKPKAFAIDRTALPTLPKGWAWEYVGNLNTEIFDGPFGSNLKTSDYIGKGVRVIRLENIGHLEFIEEKYSYISEKKYEAIKKHTVHAGDIIFSSFIIENVRLVILPEHIDRAINKADCFCVRVHGKLVRTDYLATFLSTRNAYKQIESEIHGIGRPRINTTQLKNFLVPVCSTAEQNEIMRELSKALSLILNAENTIDAELQKSEVLRQSILKKAFSGQLVAQSPADEPATVLLERIRGDKATPKPTAKKPKGKRRAA